MTLFEDGYDSERRTFAPKLRPYQREQVDSILEKWQSVQTVLLVSSVGSGKTTTFCHIVAERIETGRALIIAHRTELVDQAIGRLRLYGIEAARDQAEERARHDHEAMEVVAGTIQTVTARLKNYDPKEFTTVIIDEAHHATANSYRKLVDHFSKNPYCKILGVTGTPDRGDEAALGEVFEEVAEPVYGIEKAVADGWLVNPLQQMVEVEGLDLTDVKTTLGDLDNSQMNAILEREEVCQGIASATLQAVGDMRTLVFTRSVKEAEMLCDIFNRNRGGCAVWVCGKTPDDVRADAFRFFENGDAQFFVNVGIATEGTDMPHVQCVANARLTKARSLYEQISGRALRPVPGIVDGLKTKEERLEAIAKSAKPNALLLDFVGNSGRHKLCTVTDILGGNLSEEIIEEVDSRIRKSGKPTDVTAEIEKLRKEIEERKRKKDADRERRKGLVAKADYSTREVNPFDASDVFYAPRGWDGQATEAQRKALRNAGHKNPERYTKRQASAIISKLGPSGKQEWTLINHCGLSKDQISGMPRTQWKKVLDDYFDKKNKPPQSFTDRMINEDEPPPYPDDEMPF